MTVASAQIGKPWYREPWPWLLMAGPVIVVVAGVLTAWIALTHEDGLIAADYYTQGLAINKVIRRETAAAALDLRARVLFGESRVRVFLSAPALPQELVLRLVHRTRAGLDREARLYNGAAGWYEGEMPLVASGRWNLFLEDGDRSWRLTGDWDAATQESVQLPAMAREEEKP
ncbi:MAG TPA: FixH family protein [Burkholderiales bacterium]|nr:FixH family protein [Burkholderiales bacterium]